MTPSEIRLVSALEARNVSEVQAAAAAVLSDCRAIGSTLLDDFHQHAAYGATVAEAAQFALQDMRRDMQAALPYVRFQ